MVFPKDVDCLHFEDYGKARDLLGLSMRFFLLTPKYRRDIFTRSKSHRLQENRFWLKMREFFTLYGCWVEGGTRAPFSFNQSYKNGGENYFERPLSKNKLFATAVDPKIVRRCEKESYEI